LARRLAILVFAGIGVAALAVPRVPLEDFVHDRDVSNMQLSPDGKYLSFIHDYEGHPTICTEPVGATNSLQFDLGVASAFGPAVKKDVAGYAWIGDDRLIVTTAAWNSLYGVLAANVDAKEITPISGFELMPSGGGILLNVNLDNLLWAFRSLHRFNDPDRNILMLDPHTYSGTSQNYPDVIKVNSFTGGYTTVQKNPGNVRSWVCDHRGQVRIGLVDAGGLKLSLIYRDDEDSPWRSLDLPNGLTRLHVVSFDSDDRHIFATEPSPNKRMALYRLDPEDHLKGDLVISDPEYDIVQEEPNLTPNIGGVPATRTILSEKKGTLLGVWYLRDGPHVKWYDKDFAAFQGAVDHAMPDTVNLYVDHSRDETRVLYFCFSDRNPGTFVLLDAEKKWIHPVARRSPQIVPSQMAQMLSFVYPARDGLPIHGYITLPVGYAAKHLPLIIMPHGGPAVRDIWGFDPLVQFLANRGYAVLQMNYRGSPGYGQEFFNKGLRQVGGAIQDDIEDATKWAIAQGIADPEKIAIVGGSYGGYSTLFALAHSPGLYKCGISIAGVTDWMKIYHSHELDENEYKYAKQYWKEHIGNPDTDTAFLKSISPVNFADKITAPLLMIQGTQDFNVPPDQAHSMISALEAAGHKPESLFISDDGHYMNSARARREGFQAIESFLEAHLGAGVPPTG
jgi:dipeptidyl aminopeptidase/acylaminoacyl peptidase